MVTKNGKFSFKYSLKLHTKVIGVIYSCTVQLIVQHSMQGQSN